MHCRTAPVSRRPRTSRACTPQSGDIPSASVALAKLAAMIIGGLSMGFLLSRAIAPRVLFSVMAVIGLIAQALLFLPAHGILLATAALIVWLFAFAEWPGGR